MKGLLYRQSALVQSPVARNSRCLRARRFGFTLVEIIMVAVIIAIAAVLVLPFATSGADMQLRSAANMIASDLEYAKSMAISRGKYYWVVFDSAAESYQIEDANGVIAHPVKKGFSYVISFANDSRLDSVDISSVNFDSTNTVKFDYIGSPWNGNDPSGPLNSGAVILQAGSGLMTINVEPVTGYVSITQ